MNSFDCNSSYQHLIVKKIIKLVKKPAVLLYIRRRVIAGLVICWVKFSREILARIHRKS